MLLSPAGSGNNGQAMTPAKREDHLMCESDTDGLNLLIADDHPAIQKALGYLMEAWGYDADIVCNGLEAVEHARNGTYDLCLMDRSMPVMDGFAAVETIRRQTAYFPILMHSSDHPPPKAFLAEKGVDEWIDKACGPEYLYQRITEWGNMKTFSVVKHGNQIAVEREMPMNAQHAEELRELAQRGLRKVKFFDSPGSTVIVHKNVTNKISHDFNVKKQLLSTFINRDSEKPTECHLYKETNYLMPQLFLTEEESETLVQQEDQNLESYTGLALKDEEPGKKE
jgi:CheY-like chemotaxis protein